MATILDGVSIDLLDGVYLRTHSTHALGGLASSFMPAGFLVLKDPTL